MAKKRKKSTSAEVGQQKQRKTAQLTVMGDNSCPPKPGSDGDQDTVISQEGSSPLSDLPTPGSDIGANGSEDDHPGDDGSCDGRLDEKIDPDDLQSIHKHRIVEDPPPKHFELLCHLRNGDQVWISESVVQTINNAAVNTYWDSRSNGEGRPGIEIPPQVLTVCEFDETKRQYRVQMVGDPVFNPRLDLSEWAGPNSSYSFKTTPTYMESNVLEQTWPHQYQTWLRNKESTGNTDPKGDLQVIFGHRWNRGTTDKEAHFSNSLLFNNDAQSDFIDEEEVHKLNTPALLTYWSSDPGIREKQSQKHGIPDRCAKIRDHHVTNGTLFLAIQRNSNPPPSDRAC